MVRMSRRSTSPIECVGIIVLLRFDKPPPPRGTGGSVTALSSARGFWTAGAPTSSGVLAAPSRQIEEGPGLPTGSPRDDGDDVRRIQGADSFHGGGEVNR